MGGAGLTIPLYPISCILKTCQCAKAETDPDLRHFLKIKQRMNEGKRTAMVMILVYARESSSAKRKILLKTTVLFYIYYKKNKV